MRYNYYKQIRMNVWANNSLWAEKQGDAVFTEYLHAAMNEAQYEMLPDDGSFYGEIPGFQGVYANAKTIEDCREELTEVLEEWILLRVAKQLPLPVIHP